MNLTMTPDTNDDPLNRGRLTRSEQARINGAKSRGPKTAEGKARSSRNAMRHGLLAKRIMPLLGSDGERQEYEQHLQGLRAEFDPQTQTELNLVETIARDWVRHGRIGQIGDGLLKPFRSKPFNKPEKTYSEIQFEHQCLTAALDSLNRQDRLVLSHEQQVVVRLAVLSFFERPLMKPPAPEAKSAQPWPVDDLDVGLLRLGDVQRLAEMLAGQVELTDKELKQWINLLHQLRSYAFDRMGDIAVRDHRHERECRVAMAEDALRELPYLDRVMDLDVKSRRAIRENIELLMRLRREREHRQRQAAGE